MENKFFENALSSFVFDMAGGNAIRHLADKGYSVKRIKDMLEYPLSFEKVQKTVWEHLLDKKTILLEEPGTKTDKEKIVYVERTDRYGRKSFCGVTETDRDHREILWKSTEYSPKEKQDFLHYISEKCCQNEKGNAYISCDFGIMAKNGGTTYDTMLSTLNSRQKEYIEGLPWPYRRVYHQLDLQMQEIAGTLYQEGVYQGVCYFLDLEEKVVF